MDVVDFAIYKKVNENNIGNKCVIIEECENDKGFIKKISLSHATVIDVIPQKNTYEIDRWPYVVKASDTFFDKDQLSYYLQKLHTISEFTDVAGDTFKLAKSRNIISYNNFVFSPFELVHNRNLDILLDTGKNFYFKDSVDIYTKKEEIPEIYKRFDSIDKNTSIPLENKCIEELYGEENINELIQYILEYFFEWVFTEAFTSK